MEILNDFNTSVEKALTEIDPDWKSYDGLIICGTHSPENWEEQILKIKEARETSRPYLGICFGHQLGAIEWARNRMKIKNATSEEFGVPGTFVVKKRIDGLKVGLHNGESYWHNYEVAEGVENEFETYKPNTMITVQYHPEYQSSKEKPHRVLIDFLNLCKQTKN